MDVTVNQASKLLKGMTIAKEEKTVIKKELSADERFVQKLYSRVHTQSQLV